MYIDNGRNILTISDLWLAEEYFQQIRQTIDSLHYLLFGGKPPPLPEPLMAPFSLAPLPSRSSSRAIPRRPARNDRDNEG